MRVSHFKCVLDSGWFSVADLTCLVGKNESGKTALLEALERLNSVQETRSRFDVTEHYPRMHLAQYELSGKVATPIETEWELSGEEVLYIESLVGVPVLEQNIVRVSKSYDNVRTWTVDVNYRRAVEHYLDDSGLSRTERLELGEPSSPGELIDALMAIPEKTKLQGALIESLKQRLTGGNLRTTIEQFLDHRLPKFLYYSSYDRLPGQVSLNQLRENSANQDWDRERGNKVFIALLSMVGTTPQAFGEITKFEPLIAKLEGVSNSLSRRVFAYWSQNKNLEVTFLCDDGSPDDPPPFNKGKVFRTRIRNNRHGVTIGLDDRSTGFIWFFSFLVWFSEVTRQHGDNLVVLLDEPGLSLHSRAQADLLRFVKEELLAKYQVLYTTHSPFMFEVSDLGSVRTVEDSTSPEGQVLGTSVGERVLSTDPDTVSPLQAALGYDMIRSLLVGDHCLLVEDTSDLLFLEWFSDQLEARLRTGLDPRWTILPCGGITKVGSFVALFAGKDLHLAALTDYGKADRSKIRNFRETQLLADSHILTAAMFVPDATEADLEDILGREMYVALVNATYRLKGKKALPGSRPDDAAPRVAEEVAAHFMALGPGDPEYDHLQPARWLVTAGSADLPGVDGALARFEALFAAANALLPIR
jgi:predicted ATPase